MLNGLVSGNPLADRLEGRPVIAHEVGLRVNADLENLFGLSKREIFHYQSAHALPMTQSSLSLAFVPWPALVPSLSGVALCDHAREAGRQAIV